jgi:hypothetical protein
MSLTEERMQILKLLEQGQINAEEAAKLLAALESGRKEAPHSGVASAPRWFRVRITDLRSGKAKVNVNIPMSLVDVGLKMGARFAPDMEGVNLDEIKQAIQSGIQGKIVDVEDEEDQEHVEIFIE